MAAARIHVPTGEAAQLEFGEKISRFDVCARECLVAPGTGIR